MQRIREDAAQRKNFPMRDRSLKTMLGVGLALAVFTAGPASGDVLSIPEVGEGVCVAQCDLPTLPNLSDRLDLLPGDIELPDVITTPPPEVTLPVLPLDVTPALVQPPATSLPGRQELVRVPSLDGERAFETFRNDFQVIGALQSRAPSDLADFRDLGDPIVRQRGLLRFLDEGAWMLVRRGSYEDAAREYEQAVKMAAQDPELRESLKGLLRTRYEAARKDEDNRVLELLARNLVALDPDDATARKDLATAQAIAAQTVVSFDADYAMAEKDPEAVQGRTAPTGGTSASREASGARASESSEGGEAYASLASGSVGADSPGVVDPNDVAGGFKPAGEARSLEVSADYEGIESELAGRQPKEPPTKGPYAWRGFRDQLTEQEKNDWKANNGEFLIEASAPFDDVSGDEIAARVLWEWPTYVEDVNSDTYEHYQGTKSFLWKRAEGLGISNLRPANLLAKTHAAERLANDKNVPNDIKELALEAMRDEDRYRQLLYEDNRFSLFILGQTMQVLRERFKEEGISADAPYEYIDKAIERNAYSEVELRNAAAEVEAKRRASVTVEAAL